MAMLCLFFLLAFSIHVKLQGVSLVTSIGSKYFQIRREIKNSKILELHANLKSDMLTTTDKHSLFENLYFTPGDTHTQEYGLLNGDTTGTHWSYYYITLYDANSVHSDTLVQCLFCSGKVCQIGFYLSINSSQLFPACPSNTSYFQFQTGVDAQDFESKVYVDDERKYKLNYGIYLQSSSTDITSLYINSKLSYWMSNKICFYEPRCVGEYVIIGLYYCYYLTQEPFCVLKNSRVSFSYNDQSQSLCLNCAFGCENICYYCVNNFLISDIGDWMCTKDYDNVVNYYPQIKSP
jgi:hypothetical protein